MEVRRHHRRVSQKPLHTFSRWIGWSGRIRRKAMSQAQRNQERSDAKKTETAATWAFACVACELRIGEMRLRVDFRPVIVPRRVETS